MDVASSSLCEPADLLCFRNRPSLADCLEMKWMLQTDAIIKSRSETWFPTNKIRTFADEYDKRRVADSFRLDYTKLELTTKKPVESKRVRKERKPAAETEPQADQSVTESTKKFAPKVIKELEAEPESEAGAGESEAVKPETTEEKIEQVADDVVSKALDEAMQSSELTSAWYAHLVSGFKKKNTIYRINKYIFLEMINDLFCNLLCDLCWNYTPICLYTHKHALRKGILK